MSVKSPTLMMVVTDAVSFNILCEGQLEYLRCNWSGRIVLVCGGAQDQVEKLTGRNVGEVVQIRSFRRKPSPLADIFSAFDLLRIILKFKPDVVVYSTPKALLLTSVAALLAGVRVRMALVRGRAYENYEGLKRTAFAALDRISLKLSTKTVFISESLRRIYLEEGIAAPGKADVLGAGSSNGIDISRFRPPTPAEREACRDDLALKRNEFAVIAIGRLCADKGGAEFCEIAERVGAPFQFIWVGPVEDGALLSKIQLIGLDRGNIRHIGHVDSVLPLLWAADAHLFLTHREGFGNVAIEAAACGLPTVAFDVVGVRDSVSDGVSGVRVPFADMSAVAAALVKLQMGNSVGAGDRASAREWVEREFDQRVFWARWFRYIVRAAEQTT